MPKRTGRGDELWEALLSDDNLMLAIDEVNSSHHFSGRHKPNNCTAWVEETKEERVKDLRQIIIDGFVQKKPKVKMRWDPSAQKWRKISEPAQWPDQYVHHALIQVLQPTLMRGMDPYCCGSIRGRGTQLGKKAVERWMEKDPKGTKYEFSGDIHHFYDSIKPDGHGPDAAAIQRPAGPGPHLESYQGWGYDRGLPFAVVRQYRPATPGPAHPAERVVRPLCAVYGQHDRHRAEQTEAEEAPLSRGGVAE